ncbi:hypothetical protein BJV82DRAFT_658865 [Fennellomyces sp. T-0311]|nr:hypothetical protein BJV82DRAFT_658865 [Fennellomyces sp. T-0311]
MSKRRPESTMSSRVKRATTHVNDNIVVDSATSERLMLLDIHASAHGMLGEFNQGLLLANEMVQIAPRSPAGYLRAGELYSMAGNQLHAIGVCEQGITAVDERDQNLLRECHDRAQALLDKRVDIIGQLPLDILPIIMEEFDLRELLTMLTISRAWRSQLRECSDLWRAIELYRGQNITRYHLSTLEAVGPHIMEIKLNQVNAEVCDEVLLQIMGGALTSLRCLQIDNCEMTQVSNIYFAVARVATTLRKLDITSNTRKLLAPIPFGTLLSACRKMEHLRYMHNLHFSPQFVGSLPAGYTSSLTHLELGFQKLDKPALSIVLRVCPNIRLLALEGCPSATLDVVRRLCSKRLECLAFNQSIDYKRDALEAKYRTAKKHYTGVREILIVIKNTSDVVPLFNQHCQTIEELDMVLRPVGDIQSHTFDNCSNLSQLRRLDVSSTKAGQLLAAFLCKLPALEQLNLISCDLRNEYLVHAIKQLPNLKKLGITDKSLGNSDEIRGIFASFVRRERRLEGIGLFQSDFVDDLIMEAIARIPTLRDIQIGYAKNVTSSGIDRFCGLLEDHPNIESLVFIKLDCVTSSTLHRLAAIKNLKELTLRFMKHVTMEYLVEVFSESNVALDIDECFENAWSDSDD